MKEKIQAAVAALIVISLFVAFAAALFTLETNGDGPVACDPGRILLEFDDGYTRCVRVGTFEYGDHECVAIRYDEGIGIDCFD